MSNTFTPRLKFGIYLPRSQIQFSNYCQVGFHHFHHPFSQPTLRSELNTPHSNPTSIRPIDVINALSAPNPNGTRSRLFSSREHQDAQELFQLLSSLVQEEAEAVDKESLRDPGFAAFDRELSPEAVRKREAAKGVFEGLTANRRSCVECGYTEAVMHFSFDNLTLPVPRAVRTLITPIQFACTEFIHSIEFVRTGGLLSRIHPH